MTNNINNEINNGVNRGKRKEEEKNNRTIFYIVIIIIIILSLITSCSCTSNFFGKIGDIFSREDSFSIDDDTNDQEIILNQDLTFERDNLEVLLSDDKPKIGYSYRNIKPEQLVCTTSDAEIATCYVSSGYVVINAKKEGAVTVTLQAAANGKIYQATATVIVKDGERFIELDSLSGVINLRETKTKYVSYQLRGLSGDVSVVSNDSSIAVVESSQNGLIKIRALKKGTVTFTVSLVYQDTTYTTEYTLTVIDTPIQNTTNPNKPGSGNIGGGSSNPGGSINKKDSDSSLKSLTTNKGTIEFNPKQLTYEIELGWFNWTISLEAIPNSSKATLQYSYKDANSDQFTKVDSLDKLKLKSGDNIVLIQVTAEDGTNTIYKVIIHKNRSSDTYLKELTTDKGNLKPEFDKKTSKYEINVGFDTHNINLNAIANDKDATLSYTFNGNKVSSLENLNLLTGLNVVKIQVTAEDGSTREYEVTINREKANPGLDSDNLLKSLTDTLGKIEFDPFKNEYHISANENTNSIGISAIPNSDYANLSYIYNGQKITAESLKDLNLKPGDNKLEIIVTAADGSTNTYIVNINKNTANKSTALMELTTNKGTLTPGFNEDILEYDIEVSKDDSNISLYAKPKSDTSSLKFTYNGNSVNSINDLELKYGYNEVVITVVDKDKNERSYYVNIFRPSPLSHDATLKDITIDGNSVFDTLKANVSTNVSSVVLVGIPNDNKAKVTYLYGNEEYQTPDELAKNENLQPGANTIKIKVTAEDGYTIKIYEVTVIREVDGSTRTICLITADGCLPTNSYKIRMENVPYSIPYAIYEDGIEVTDYLISEIKRDFIPESVLYEIEKGRIILKPTNSYIGKNIDLKLTYRKQSALAKISFITDEYFVKLSDYTKEIGIMNGVGTGNIILNTNLFTDIANFEAEMKNDTLCLKENNASENIICFNIKEGKDFISLEYVKDSGFDYPAIQVNAKKTGKVVIEITSSAYGKKLENIPIEIEIKEGFQFTLNPNEGFFKGFEERQQISFVVNKEDTVDLSKYLAYKTEEKENCKYYTLESYNTKPDGTGTSYKLTDVLNNFDANITLYAIYSTEEEFVELTDDYKMYLIADLFHNEEYYELYDTESTEYKEDVIYPGAKGSYVMTFYNNSSSDITITGLTLEEDTICVKEKGCLNMGYVIKSYSSDSYYYGSSSSYAILNTDPETVINGPNYNRPHTKRDIDFTPKITVEKGKAIEVSLLWKWEDNDEIDAYIGAEAAKTIGGEKYALRVSLNFEKNNIFCSKE